MSHQMATEVDTRSLTEPEAQRNAQTSPLHGYTAANFPLRKHRRIGEAQNPGPPDVVCMDDPEGPDEPDTMIFDMTPLHSDEEPLDAAPTEIIEEPPNEDRAQETGRTEQPKAEKEDASTRNRPRRRAKRKVDNLVIETINGTSWSAILKRLNSTYATVLCIQDHRLPASVINDKSSS